MYVCRCHTCEVVRSAVGRERVQRFFNDHAADEHEVVLRRVGSTGGPLSGAPDRGPDAGTPSSAGPSNGER